MLWLKYPLTLHTPNFIRPLSLPRSQCVDVLFYVAQELIARLLLCLNFRFGHDLINRLNSPPILPQQNIYFPVIVVTFFVWQRLKSNNNVLRALTLTAEKTNLTQIFSLYLFFYAPLISLCVCKSAYDSFFCSDILFNHCAWLFLF